MQPKVALEVVLACAVVLACGKDPVGGNGDPQVTLSADSVTVAVGTSAAVTATVRNAVASTQFTSRDQSVATVNASGAISGVGIGSTYVVATLAGHASVRDSVRVRVQAQGTAADDSCVVEPGRLRPDFGGLATAADRAVFAYDVKAPLNLQKAVESTIGAVEVTNIAYNSPDGGTVTGMMFDPITRSSLRPGIVLMHGMPGNARQMAGYATALAQYGAVVIAIDAPHARRTGNAVLFTNQDRTEQIQLIKDLQRAVDVLRAKVNVDADRIGYVGVSYGGAMGTLFAGIERRIKTAVLVVADGGLVTHYTGPEDLDYMRSFSCATRLNWFRSMVPIEPIRYIAGAAPTTLLFQNGRFDALVPMGDAQQLHASVPEPRTIMWYDAGHGLNQQAVLDRHEWLRVQIGLDALQ